MGNFIYYFINFMQFIGMALVTVCLGTGIYKGDYGKIELYQFIGGSFLFYMGHFFKGKYFHKN